MAKAKKCDRCGSYYQLDREMGVFTNLAESDEFCKRFKSYDLCPSCRDAFKDWVKGGEQDATLQV